VNSKYFGQFGLVEMQGPFIHPESPDPPSRLNEAWTPIYSFKLQARQLACTDMVYFAAPPEIVQPVLPKPYGHLPWLASEIADV
jgi:hypothetical protein